MTRLFDAPHGQIHELEKRLQAAGFTAEMLKALLADDKRLRAWVVMLDQEVEPDPPIDRVPIEAAFGGKGGVMHRLLQMHFVYLDEVAEMTEHEFLNMHGFGQTSLRTMKAVLTRHGLQFSTTYSSPSVLINGGFRNLSNFYRPRVKAVELWQLASFSYYEDSVDTDTEPGWGDTTLGAFMDMSHEQRALILSDSGIAKVEAFIATNGI